MRHPDYTSVKKALQDKLESDNLNKREVFVLEGAFVEIIK